jgi:hypothetical protein
MSNEMTVPFNQLDPQIEARATAMIADKKQRDKLLNDFLFWQAVKEVNRLMQLELLAATDQARQEENRLRIERSQETWRKTKLGNIKSHLEFYINHLGGRIVPLFREGNSNYTPWGVAATRPADTNIPALQSFFTGRKDAMAAGFTAVGLHLVGQGFSVVQVEPTGAEAFAKFGLRFKLPVTLAWQYSLGGECPITAFYLFRNSVLPQDHRNGRMVLLPGLSLVCRGAIPCPPSAEWIVTPSEFGKSLTGNQTDIPMLPEKLAASVRDLSTVPAAMVLTTFGLMLSEGAK